MTALERMQCDGCGKYIKFPASRLGATVSCPNCQATLTLHSQSPVIDRPPEFPPPLPPLAFVPQPAAPVTASPVSAIAPTVKQEFVQRRIPAALFALLLFGPLGSHKFYLGQTTAGGVMLTSSAVGILGACLMFPLLLLLVTSTIALIEGIIYLTKTDEQFFEDYAVRRKQWF